MNEKLIFIILNFVIIIGIIGKVYIIYRLIISYSSGVESLIRALAVTGACFIYLIFKTFGFSVTDILISALTTGNLMKFSVFGFVVPLILGILLTEYIILTIKTSESKAMRILILVATLSIFQYVDLYLTAYGVSSELSYVSSTKVLITNIMFTISTIITVIFRYDPKHIN
ncbi:hypothetical protein [Flavivirga algicola]|uniref:Uncharacterized protein n=1 Tax=Flavivirga algicola TaxID=2729136 RepID=A0ABX1S4W7_9FLAO|nr:hypothetical protein [Flavivirga algicola]NMH89575.1 hypothetical protein [Flavivirga algicola]